MRKLIICIGTFILIIMLGLWITPNMPEDNLLIINSLNAKEVLFKISNFNFFQGKIINKLVTRSNAPLQDIWVEISANKTVIPGGVYNCSIKLWSLEVDPIDSIKIIYLAPNSKNLSLGLDDKLYTSLDESSVEISGPSVTELIRDIHSMDETYPGKLDSLVWLIPELPITVNENDTVKISFTLGVDILISSSIKLNNDFLLFVIKEGQESLILSDNKVTEILLVPEIQIEKCANKDTVKLGDFVDFSIYIRNYGGKAADSIFIFDEIPQELKFIDFIFSDDAATRTRGTDADSQKLTWLIEKIPKFGSEGSRKEVGFTAKVRNDIEIVNLIEEIFNVAEFKRGEKESGLDDENLYICSDPDIIGQITNIIIAREWSYEDSIKIDCIVKNIGGTDITDNFIARLYYVDMERAPLDKIPIWEDTVYASRETIKAFEKNSIAIPTQSIRFDKGGTYKLCLYVDVSDVIRERNEDNNEFCEIREIRIPAKFYLSRNVVILDQLPTGVTSPIGDGIFSIKAQIPYDCQVKINIYDEAGDLVKNLFNNFRAEGYYDPLITWDYRDEGGSIVGSGVYVFVIEARNYHDTPKVIIVR